VGKKEKKESKKDIRKPYPREQEERRAAKLVGSWPGPTNAQLSSCGSLRLETKSHLIKQKGKKNRPAPSRPRPVRCWKKEEGGKKKQNGGEEEDALGQVGFLWRTEEERHV